MGGDELNGGGYHTLHRQIQLQAQAQQRACVSRTQKGFEGIELFSVNRRWTKEMFSNKRKKSQQKYSWNNVVLFKLSFREFWYPDHEVKINIHFVNLIVLWNSESADN